MKKFLTLLVSLTLLFSLAACGLFGEDDTTIDEGTTYTAIDINPSIELILDEDGLVLSVAYINEDAEIVAADLNLVGLPFSEALELYLDAAVETGYIDVDSQENIVTVTNDDADLEDTIKDDIQAIFTEQGIGAAIFGGEMDDDYAILAEEHDISIGRARLISRAIEIDDTLTFETALELTHQEIMQILVDAHRARMEDFIAERRQNAMALKEQMRFNTMDRVEEHRSDVEEGLVDTPNYDAIRTDVEANLETIRTNYQDRINQARQNARDRKDQGLPGYVDAEDYNYASIDINPSIEFIVNEHGIVITVSYVNEDAEIVAADLELVGLPFEDALELYLEAAIETGYLDVDSQENIITISTEDQDLENDLKADVETILEDRGIGAAIFGGEMLDDYAALAEEHDISIGRARLISRAIEIDDTLTFETALELTHQEIMQILVDAHRARMEDFIAERRQAALELKNEMRDDAMERVEQHRANVDAGLVDTPDYNKIRSDVEADLETIRSNYQDRINQARQNAKDRQDNNIPNNNDA